MTVMGAAEFERFFEAAADLEVSGQDLGRYNEFVDRKLYDLLLVGAAHAGAGRREAIEPQDLPVTKGLQESAHAYRKMAEVAGAAGAAGDSGDAGPWTEPGPLLEETTARLPELAGGISVALARALRALDTADRTPTTEDWDLAFELFDLLI
jgi:hypothetical protein